MFGLFEIMFPIVFLLVIGTFIYGLVRNIGTSWKAIRVD